MGFEALYLNFSIVMAVGICLRMVGMLRFRSSGRSLTGNSYKAGTPEYRKLQKHTTNRRLVITSIIAFLLQT